MTEGKQKVKDTSVCTFFSQPSTKKRVNAAVITCAEARFHVLFSCQCFLFFCQKQILYLTARTTWFRQVRRIQVSFCSTWIWGEGSSLVVSLVNLVKITGYQWMKRWRAELQDQSAAAIASFFCRPFPVVLYEHPQKHSVIHAPSCSRFWEEHSEKLKACHWKKVLTWKKIDVGPRDLRVFLAVCSDSSTSALMKACTAIIEENLVTFL